MAPLGSRQLERLKSMAHVGAAQMVPDAVSRSLVARGLMQPTGDTARSADGLLVITANGYRAIADAIDAGQISHRPDWAKLRTRTIRRDQ